MPNVRKFAVLAAGLACVHVLMLAFIRNAQWLVPASDLIQVLSCGLAFWACLDARARAGDIGRAFWAVCSTSYLLWMIAQLFWTYDEFRFGSGGEQLGFTDVLFFFSFAPFAILLVSDPSKEQKVDWQRTLDFVQVGIVILCAYLYFFYVPSRWETEEQTVKRMVGQVFFYRNLALTTALWLRTWISTGKRERSLFFTAAASLTVYSVLTRVANYARLEWGSGTGSWFDLGWTAPFLLSAVVIAFWRDSAEPEEGPKVQGTQMKRQLAIHLTPMLVPALILYLGAKIAADALPLASIAILTSFLCYSLRLWVTQYRQLVASEALARAEERFRTVFACNPQPSWVFDQNTLQFLEVNDTAIRQYGYSRDEFLKMQVTQIRPDDELERFLQRGRSEGAYTGEWRHRAKDGKAFDVLVTAQPFELAGRACTLVIAQNITERKKLEAHLRQAQKMEAVGTLAGGIAHDFNNVLTIITGYSQVVLERAKGDAVTTREVRQIEGAAQRAAGLVRQLLAFSRQQVVQPRVMNLRALIEDVEKMLRPLLSEDVSLETRFAPLVGKIKADPGQMEQVLVNLALNAKDAMEEDPNKQHKLSFSLENVELSEEEASGLALKAGKYLLLTVSDTGCGMEKAVQERIFEPFFTTKVSEGTGLGLSTVYGIVQQSKGAITVESAPGMGTTFRIYLPPAEQALLEGVKGEKKKGSGRETILIVEDDHGLRELTMRVLSKFEYKVYSASQHAEAEAICAQHGDEIELLLTDVVMPEVSGKELADRLQVKYPKMIVLFMSGYTNEVVLKQGVMEGSMNFIQKPFTPAALAQKVREVLDAAHGSSTAISYP